MCCSEERLFRAIGQTSTMDHQMVGYYTIADDND